MSQISPPIRILLVAAMALAAVWALVLQPKSNDDTAAAPVTPVETPAGVARDANGPEANTSLGKAVQSAEGAAAKSDEANAAVQAATGETEAPATTQAAPKTEAAKPAPAEKAPVDPALADLPKWLQTSIDDKVVAILFWDKNASDDRRTHDALDAAFNGHGKVVKRSVPISKIAEYGAVARGVDVTQSPTLMVIDRDRNASSLVGFANVDSINQVIIDGLLATDNPAKKVGIVKDMQAACKNFATTETISAGDSTPSKEYAANLSAVGATLSDALKAAPAAKGPYKAQANLLRSYIKSEQGVVSKIRSGAVGNGFVNSRTIRTAQQSNDKLEARATLELNAIGVTGCN